MNSFVQIALGSTVLLLGTGVQIAGMVWMANVLPRLAQALRPRPHSLSLTLILGATVLGLLAVHTLQVWLWAQVFLLSGALPDLATALYFAMVTYTTLGYGDVVLAEGQRLFATFAAVEGLLAFGLSTALLVGVVTRLLEIKGE